MIVVLLELLVGGVLREEQLDEILEVADRSWQKKVKPIGGYSLQAGGEDLVQDEVISNIDHRLVLILVEMFDRVALNRVAVKGQNHFLRNLHSNMSSEKGELGASTVMALSLS